MPSPRRAEYNPDMFKISLYFWLSVAAASAGAGPCEILLVGERDRGQMIALLQGFVPELLPDARMIAAGRLADLNALHRLLTVRSDSIRTIERSLLYVYAAAMRAPADSALARAVRRLQGASDQEEKLIVCLIPADCAVPYGDAFHAFLGTSIVIGTKARRTDDKSSLRARLDLPARERIPINLHVSFLREQTSEGNALASHFMVDLLSMAVRFDVTSALNEWVETNRSAIDRGAGGLLGYVQRDRGRYVIKQGFAELLLEVQINQVQLEFLRAVGHEKPEDAVEDWESLARRIEKSMPLARRVMARLNLSPGSLPEWAERAMQVILTH